MPLLGETLDLWRQRCAQDLREYFTTSGYVEFMEKEFPFHDEAEALKRHEGMMRFIAAQEEFMRRKAAARRGE